MVSSVDGEENFILVMSVKIMESMNLGDDIAVLNQAKLLFSILPDDKKKELKIPPVEKRIEGLLEDEHTMRILRLMQKIKSETETSIEYYYKDRGQDERLYYNKELETDLISVNKEIRNAISKIIADNQGITL